jgi:chromosome segregation ATPase
MSEPNLKAMTQAELLKYLEEDFMPRLLPKLANVKNIESENARLKAELTNCKSEADRLKAEVERLTALIESNLNSSKVAMGKADAVLYERDSLKAEVERLTQEYSDATNHYNKLHNDLQAEVERLRKAGDAMYVVIYGFNWLAFNKDITNTLKAWNAAKEGKPSV